jgi:Cu-processing system permease protein
VLALTIARFTIQEAITRRLVLAGVLLSLAFLALFGFGFAFLHGLIQQEAGPRAATQMLPVMSAMLTLLGLYAINFLSGFLALFLAVGAVSSEIDSGTLHALLARPIRRAEFILGRWLAYAGLVAVYVGGMAGALLGLAYLISGFQAPDPPRAIGLMILAALILMTLSLFGSTILSTLANGVVVFSLFGLAWLGGMIEFIGAALQNEAMLNLGTAVSLVIPSDAVWRGASYFVQPPVLLSMAMAGPGGLPFFSLTPPAMPMVVWALGYPLVFLIGAILTFRRRDL